MATLKTRVRLVCEGRAYNFLSVKEQLGGDGTLHVALDRSGSGEAYAVDFAEGEVAMGPPETREKGVKISYHPSGRVNYHRLARGRVVFRDPLYALSADQPLLDFWIPDVRRLDEAPGLVDDDSCIEVPAGARLGFRLVIGPCHPAQQNNQVLWAMELRPLFCVSLLPAPGLPRSLEEEKGEYFLYLPIDEGAFKVLQVDQDDAYCRFHQALHETQGDVIYPPNGAGCGRVVYVVPMRRSPDVAIKHVRDDYDVALEYVDNRHFRFTVRDRHGNLVKDPSAVAVTFTRDAEIY